MPKTTTVAVQHEAPPRMPRMVDTKWASHRRNVLLLMDRDNPDRPRLAAEVAEAERDQILWDRVRTWAQHTHLAFLETTGYPPQELVRFTRKDITGKVLQDWTPEHMWNLYIETHEEKTR